MIVELPEPGADSAAAQLTVPPASRRLPFTGLLANDHGAAAESDGDGVEHAAAAAEAGALPAGAVGLLSAEEEQEIRAAGEAGARAGLEALQEAADEAAAEAVAAVEAERARLHYKEHEELHDGAAGRVVNRPSDL